MSERTGKKQKLGGNSRLRTNNNSEIPITDADASAGLLILPDAALTRSATFLNFNDKIMLAMALPTWEEEQTHEITKAIIGAELVETINFETDVGEGVATALTDRDLRHILNGVDAVHNLKRLILTHCDKIRGHGLDPLRGSSTLVAVDLSLMGRYESPPEDHSHSLCMDEVLLVLFSIIRAEVCSLRHIQLPKN